MRYHLPKNYEDIFIKDISPTIKFDMLPYDSEHVYKVLLKDVLKSITPNNVYKFRKEDTYFSFKCVTLSGWEEIGIQEDREYELHLPIMTFMSAWYEATGYKVLNKDDIVDVECEFKRMGRKKLRFIYRKYYFIK